MKLPSGITLSLLLITSSLAAHTQSIEKYHRPFKADSVQSFNNIYVQYRMIPTIKESHFSLEIRWYVPTTNFNRGSIYQIQWSEDTIVLIKIDYYLKPTYQGAPYKNGGISTDSSNLLNIYVRSKKTPDQTLVTKLLDHHLFTVSDTRNRIDSIFRMNKSIDRENIHATPQLYEVKYNDQFRNFIDCAAADYVAEDKTLRDIVEITYVIANVFRKEFN